MKRSRMPGGVKLCAWTLASFASKEGANVYPSVERLAREMQVSERTVNRAMSWLREAGWITKTKQGNRHEGKTNEYQLTLPADVLEQLWLDPDGQPLSDTDVAQTAEVQTTLMSLRPTGTDDV